MANSSEKEIPKKEPQEDDEGSFLSEEALEDDLELIEEDDDNLDRLPI